MFEKLEVMRMASGMVQHATMRQKVVAQNIANADTPGYRSSDLVSFQELYTGEALRSEMRKTRPGHVGATDTDFVRIAMIDAEGGASPNGNTVSLETEMMRGSEVRLQHDMATSIYKTSIDILRASIGRGR